jgi:putative transposase
LLQKEVIVVAGSREKYQRGAHTVVDLKYHFVWKTKYSYKILSGDIGLRARAVIREICAEHEMTVVKGNVRPDHIHVLVSAPSHLSPAKMAQFLKGKSSYRLQRDFPELRKKYWGQQLWGRGYFCSTVGAVTEEMIKSYIENQGEDDQVFQVWDEAKLPNEPDGSSSVLV